MIQQDQKKYLYLIQSIKEVTQLFVDLAALVNLQGEIIDNIEINIRSAKDAVISAEDDIIRSKKNMISARKVTIS